MSTSQPAPKTPPQPLPKEPPKSSNLVEDKPSVKNPGAFFIGKEVTIYSPPGHLLTNAYSDVDEGEAGELGPVTLLDCSFDDTGAPLWAIVKYKEKNARKYFFTDLVPLDGCSLSLSIERKDEEDAE